MIQEQAIRTLCAGFISATSAAGSVLLAAILFDPSNPVRDAVLWIVVGWLAVSLLLGLLPMGMLVLGGLMRGEPVKGLAFPGLILSLMSYPLAMFAFDSAHLALGAGVMATLCSTTIFVHEMKSMSRPEPLTAVAGAVSMAAVVAFLFLHMDGRAPGDDLQTLLAFALSYFGRFVASMMFLGCMARFKPHHDDTQWLWLGVASLCFVLGLLEFAVPSIVLPALIVEFYAAFRILRLSSPSRG